MALPAKIKKRNSLWFIYKPVKLFFIWNTYVLLRDDQPCDDGVITFEPLSFESKQEARNFCRINHIKI